MPPGRCGVPCGAARCHRVCPLQPGDRPERYFCWAPYDEHTFYTIEVEVDGRKLSKSEIADRYRYYPGGWEPRSIHNVISQVSQFESTYGVDDGAKIVIEYETNGHPKRRWEWPVR